MQHGGKSYLTKFTGITDSEILSNREATLKAENLYSAVPVPAPILSDFTFIIGFNSAQCRQKCVA